MKKKTLGLVVLGTMTGTWGCELVLSRFGWSGWLLGASLLFVCLMYILKQEKKAKNGS